VISRAEVEDIAGILAIERAVVEAPHWPEAVYREMMAGAPEAGRPQRCLLVARRDEKLAGFAVGKVLGEVAELENLVVGVGMRRMGIGRALCATIVSWAWEQGAARMELEVRRSNAGAIALYRELGFGLTGERRGYYMGPAEDAVLMSLVGTA
jgi:ribosomal-protein-alanine N-acetyltransferase